MRSGDFPPALSFRRTPFPTTSTSTARPVFYPGTYSSGPDQGGEPWGICPPLNNYFDFIWLAYLLWKDTGRAEMFSEMIEGANAARTIDVGLCRAAG